MKFPSYTQDPAARFATWRHRFGELAGSADNDSAFGLVSYLAEGIANYLAESGQARLVISVAGGQGTGKSTMTNLLAAMLADCCNVTAATLSLDDFYMTRDARNRLAADIHPLLAVRGVPGTHDIHLLESTIASLRAGESVEVPIFNKAEDDRGPDYRKVVPASVILCEGWCWGAKPEPDDRLRPAINLLEQIEDPSGIWRRYVNEQLSQYQVAFEADARLFFKAPSIEAIVRWRFQQERELESSGGGSEVMAHADVERFVTFYERITRWMIEEMPSRADVSVSLDDDHQIAGVAVQ